MSISLKIGRLCFKLSKTLLLAFVVRQTFFALAWAGVSRVPLRGKTRKAEETAAGEARKGAGSTVFHGGEPLGASSLFNLVSYGSNAANVPHLIRLVSCQYIIAVHRAYRAVFVEAACV